MNDADYFLELQTNTGWGRVLIRLRDWIEPQAGWLTLDVGCGPGLMPALLAQNGCRALGVDLDPEMFRPAPLHPQVALADALRLPFPAETFDLVTASNLLFLLPRPQAALREMARLLRPGGQMVALNPAEQLSRAAAESLADSRNLTGFARRSLLNWAGLAERHARWTETETADLFAAAGLTLTETRLTMSPGFARFARGVKRGAAICHITTTAAWQNARTAGVYRADSLESEGFIHCSTPQQVLDTANRYYAGREDLLLLWIDPQRLAADLRWEAAHGERYPHLYGALNLDAVTGSTPLRPDPDGIFRTLPGERYHGT